MEQKVKVLQRVAQTVGNGRNLHEVLQELTDMIPQATGVPRCTLFLVNRERRELAMAASAGLSPDAVQAMGKWRPSLDTLTCIQHEMLIGGHAVTVEDVATDPRLVPEEREQFGCMEACSILGVPLRIRDQGLGYFALASPHRPHVSSGGALSLAEIIASQAALVIDRARAWEEAHKASAELARLQERQASRMEKCQGAQSTAQDRRVRALHALVEAGIAITSELSLDKVLQRIVDVARGVLHARYAALGVVAEGKAHLERFLFAGMDAETVERLGGHLPEGHGILGALLTEGRPLRLRDLTQDPRSVGFPPHHPPMRSFLGVPIISRGRIFGRLYFTEKEGAEEFSEEDESLAFSLASQAAVAIENAYLFQELQEQQDRLIRAERLSAIGALAATVSHELRNPLSVINNAVFFLNAKVPREDLRIARNLDVIRREIQLATHIIEDLLNFSRIRPLQMVPVEAATLVRDTLSRQPIPENVQVENQVPSDMPSLAADPEQMLQILGNLIENAVQAMPEGGTLRLEGTTESQRAILRVSDTGIGIAPENLGRIFEPLFTTKSRGVGLGLAFVRRVVEAHGGHIHVESEPGKGTAFVLDLPTAEVECLQAHG
ncbi:MAG: GAF domain-containing protein [Candidatus Tectomicrobia bacterium]|uniref:histidine kinase n=1 Tax=Tectimicrobiota bacterium TaxID=2528274 RepID=A0A932CNV9_UNCTE|nr:GAF domain-containing protein [Candidatus Tectomicrobia bacterium]